MAKPPGLRRRGGSWEMRVRTPKALRSALPTEMVKSLGGVSAKDANRLGWLARAEIELKFEKAEVELGLTKPIIPAELLTSHQISDAEIVSAAKRYLRNLEADAIPAPLDEERQRELREALIEEAYSVGQPYAAEDAGLQSAADKFAADMGITLPEKADRFPYYSAIREAELEHLSRQLARLGGTPVATINPAFAGVDGSQPEEGTGCTLAEAITMYMNAPERSSNSESSRKMDRSRLGALRDVIGASRPVRSITKADLRDYVEQLMKLPQHYTQRYPGKSPAQAIAAAAKDNAPTLSPASIKRSIQAVRSFFGWLEKQDIVAKNPAKHIEGPRAPKKSARRPFTADEMRALLNATPKSGKEALDWRYWLTRITVLHGFRLTEPLGLQVKDLVKQGESWVIRLRPNKFRSLKTEDTARDVPLHPRLIEIGILDLLEGRDPEELLIPGVSVGKGKAFNLAQKRISRLIREHVSNDPNLTFHSLRHSFRDAMRDGGFPRGIEERLGGWKSTSNDAMEGYGRGYRMEALSEWIAKLAHDGVEID